MGAEGIKYFVPAPDITATLPSYSAGDAAALSRRPWVRQAMTGPTDRTPAALVALAAAIYLLVSPVCARDLGQWENADPEAREWFSHLMQPDNPAVSCCGTSDAYWCDELHTRTDAEGKPHNFCNITDDRPDEPLRRMHIDIGTEIEIPDSKMKYGPEDPQAGEPNKNPTGHAIAFLSRALYVFCFVPGGGV